MPIRKNASMEKYIKDFEKSDAPQFKDKSKDKRVQMAVAAKLQAMGKKKMEESELTEAYVPSNIKEFAKRKGVTSLVNKVAKWVEEVGKSISGGTAVGKNYSTLVLDITREGSEIRIDTENGTVTLHNKPVRNSNEFQRVYADGEGNNLEEGLKDFTDLQLQDLKMKYHSQISAEKDPKKKEYLKQDLKDLEAELSNRKSGKVNESRENDIVASMDPNHPLATKDVEQWDDEDMKEYKKLWDKKHGNDTVKDMLKKAVTKKLKEVGPMSPEDKKANDLEIQAQKAKIAAATHRIQNLQKGDALTEIYDFFEDTIDDDNYVDVSGQSVEMTMEELLMEFEERLKDIPEESRKAGLRAIKTFWINMIKDWNPDLTTPHRAPITEAKHPIFEVKEYDYEGQMARTQLISIVKNAKSLFDSIGDKTQLQAWVQSKLTKAEDYLNAVRSYLEGESISNTAPLMVNNEPARDDEGTALNIGDVVRAANGGIYQAVHSYSEGKPFLTPFDLKKRKPTNLRDRHYFDNISEDGMSITKKMYKVMSHNQTKGGFTK